MVPVLMRKGRAQSWCRCGVIPVAEPMWQAGVGRVPVQIWHHCPSHCRYSIVPCSHVVAIHLLVKLGAELDVGDKDGPQPLNANPSLPRPLTPCATSYPVRHGIPYDIPCETVCRGIPRGLVRQAALR